jgi:hypothetical protein
MEKSFGIAGIIAAVVAIIAPYGLNLAVIAVALLLVSAGALAGERTFAVAAALVCAANIFVFSPLTLLAVMGAENEGGFLGVVLVFLALPFAAIALNASGKVVLNKHMQKQ